MAGAIQEVCKELTNNRRLKSSEETLVAPVEAATAATVTAPPSMPAHMVPFQAPFAKVSVPEKFNGNQGFKTEVLNTHIEL